MKLPRWPRRTPEPEMFCPVAIGVGKVEGGVLLRFYTHPDDETQFVAIVLRPAAAIQLSGMLEEQAGVQHWVPPLHQPKMRERTQ